jgi:GDPmannose 4,6-dehydratase
MTVLENKRIVVTGGAGFLGQAVCKALAAYAPAKIVVPRSSQYDLRRQPDVERLMRKERPEIVIHLAAVVGGIGANRESPGKFFYDNAAMGLHVMEEARRVNAQKFVSIGTICSYPKNTPVPFREDDLWNGYPEDTNAPYGLAKKMLLVQGQAYRRQYGFNAITLLPVNLYGPGDSFDPATSHVIPALIRKVIEARDAGRQGITAWGTGQATREFLFVRDAAKAICVAADRYNDEAPLNIGSGIEISIRELTELICDLCDFHGEIQWDCSQPDGQLRRWLDTSRASSALGFQAETNLRDGLTETIDWFQKQRAKASSPPRVLNPALITPPKQETSERRAFITGITGQDGSYLAELLLKKKYEVHGMVRRSSTVTTERIGHLYRDPHDPNRKLLLHFGDLTDGQCVSNLVLDLAPDEIYHLGAQSHVGVSFDQPNYTAQTIAVGTLSILEAARQLNKRQAVRVFHAASSEMYGEAVESPQTETTPFRPQSPYACAKVYAFHQTVNYRRAHGLFAANGILFNHESPRRGETFVTRKITRAATRIKLGFQEKLYLGNLEARRDWGYAKDYVEAMWRILQYREPDDFVLATGQSHSVREFVELVFGILELNWRDYVSIDATCYRPAEVDELQGNARKANELLEWRPTTDFNGLVHLMVEHDLSLAREEVQRPIG